MNIRQIKVFHEVYHQKSLTKAAASLYISQQALSSTINSLEKELDTLLFRRTTQGMILTDAGKYLLELMTPVIQDFDNALNSFANRYNSNSGDLVMALVPGMLRSINTELLLRFQELYPKIKIITRDCLDTEGPEKVLNGEVDIALCPKPINHIGLKYITINIEPLYAIVGSNHPLANRDTISMAELKNETFVSLNEKHRIHYLTIDTYAKLGITPKIVAFSAEIGYLFSMIKKNPYVFICVEHILDGISKEFKPILLRDPEMIWDVGIVLKRTPTPRHIIKVFTKVTKEMLAQKKQI